MFFTMNTLFIAWSLKWINAEVASNISPKERKSILKSASTNHPPTVCVSGLHVLLRLVASEPKMSRPANPASQVLLKILVNYPAHTVVLANSPTKNYCGGEEKQIGKSHPCDRRAETEREMTDF